MTLAARSIRICRRFMGSSSDGKDGWPTSSGRGLSIVGGVVVQSGSHLQKEVHPGATAVHRQVRADDAALVDKPPVAPGKETPQWR